MSKIGRNDLCPCGSGKKYKKCCLPKTYVQMGREESLKGRLVEELLRYFKRNYDARLVDAEDFFWGDFFPEEHLSDSMLGFAEINFWEWVVFDLEVDEESGKTLIDLYINDSKGLTTDELKVLNKMRNAVVSLYEVLEVFPDEGLLVNDLLLGGEYDIREKMATRSLRKWDIFAARLLEMDGIRIMSGAVYPYPIREKDAILGNIRAEYEDYVKDYPNTPMAAFLKKNSHIFNFLWYDIIQSAPPIRLATTTGEPVLFSKAIFELRDRDAARKGLKKIKGFRLEQEDEFVWLDKPREDGSATVLGNIGLKDKELVLECNSRKRLTRGKKFIVKALGNAVVHKADILEDPMQAVKRYQQLPHEDPAEELPPKIQQELYTSFMKTHSEEWLNEPIPALSGLTPLEAIKTDEGRAKVTEILKIFENREEHNRREGRPYYDLRWLWEKLGLKRDSLWK